MSQIHPALLRKDNYFKTVPVGKLVALFQGLVHFGERLWYGCDLGYFRINSNKIHILEGSLA